MYLFTYIRFGEFVVLIFRMEPNGTGRYKHRVVDVRLYSRIGEMMLSNIYFLAHIFSLLSLRFLHYSRVTIDNIVYKNVLSSKPDFHKSEYQAQHKLILNMTLGVLNESHAAVSACIVEVDGMCSIICTLM